MRTHNENAYQITGPYRITEEVTAQDARFESENIGDWALETEDALSIHTSEIRALWTALTSILKLTTTTYATDTNPAFCTWTGVRIDKSDADIIILGITDDGNPIEIPMQIEDIENLNIIIETLNPNGSSNE